MKWVVYYWWLVKNQQIYSGKSCLVGLTVYYAIAEKQDLI